MQDEPMMSKYSRRRHGAVLKKMEEFNRCYMHLLDRLQVAFTGAPDEIQDSVGHMFELKHRAVELMRIPNPLDDGETSVGPSFEYICGRT